MRSIKFPKMFNSTNTEVWKSTEHKEATMQNILTLLSSYRNELLGDPYFGTKIKQYFFEQNSYILKDVIIDMIYNSLATFIPQVRIERKNIDIIQDREKGKLYCTIKAINQIDYTLNSYSLVLFESENI